MTSPDDIAAGVLGPSLEGLAAMRAGAAAAGVNLPRASRGRLSEALAGVPVRLWFCPVEEHREWRDSNGVPVQTVEWDGDVAYCTYRTCGRDSTDPVPRGECVCDGADATGGYDCTGGCCGAGQCTCSDTASSDRGAER